MAVTGARIRLLGQPVVEIDGREIEPPPRTHGLLGILALSPDGVERGELARMVAPDRSDQQARRRLSRLIWLLREALPELPLTASTRRVRLDPEHCRIDVAEIEELVDRNDATADEAAFARLAGPFCPQSDLPWAQRRRERLAELAARLGIRVAEARLGRGDHVGARDAADWVLDHHPASTRALELRLTADLALGHGEESLCLVTRWCQRRGIDESEAPPAVRDLATALRTGRPQPLAPPPDDAPASAWLRHARNAGERGDEEARQRALERLRAAVDSGELPRSASRLAEIDAALDRFHLPLAERLLAMAASDSDAADLRVRRCRLALARRDLEAAAAEASEALVDAYVDQREDARLEALIALATVQSERARGRDALAAAAQAREAAQRLGRLDAELRAEVVTGREEIRQGWYAPAASRMERVRERAAAAHLARVEGHALRELARARSRMGEFVTAASLQEEELRMWRRLNHAHREAGACNEHAYTLICMGRHADAEVTTARARELADRIGAELASAWARAFAALAIVCREGASSAAFDASAEAAEAAEEVADPEVIAVASLVRGFLSYVCSDPSTALAHLARAREQYVTRGESAHMPVVLALEALVRLQLGETDTALATTAHGLTEVAQLNVSDFGLPLHYAHACALRAAGRDDEARRWIERGMERIREIAAKTGLPEDAVAGRDPLTRALAAEAAGGGASAPSGVPEPWLPR